ncbi:hypothetical protein MKW98_022810 [Papaver atlanticum]|uniref:Uncharacterized protein n=1 Tax=Papaver atlanticum TaxID=357466 RepID=A0AAD4XZ65_9MAGN|nr:hypothetical protein MKW98_022810 [Papaver atlanticum]
MTSTSNNSCLFFCCPRFRVVQDNSLYTLVYTGLITKTTWTIRFTPWYTPGRNDFDYTNNDYFFSVSGCVLPDLSAPLKIRD